ncbi:phage portal protein [Pararhodobacter zhoushanensis]|uniref:phage portal protein n=1 Tax=Pararhodobacter zhoushanensis TaxID=2479545 RepID=UPI000F8F043D|nr:phage portal protein [Pararhodobacter zhoushanensis]
MNAIDWIVGQVSPAAAVKRAQAREAMRVMAHYRAGDLTRRSESLRAVNGDADAVAMYARRGLSLVARDVIRNNPIAASALSVIVNNVIGTGIEPRLVSKDKGLKREWADLIKPRFDTLAIDVDGVSTLGGLQALAFSACVTDGEALVVWPLPGTRGASVRVLEAEFLDDRLQGPVGRGRNLIFDGIEYDGDRVVAYHLFDEHPGSPVLGSNMRGLTSSRVDASRVAHLFRVDRPGQRRGVTWFAGVLDDLVALSDNDEAQLMRQKIAACFAAFWRTDDGDNEGIPNTLAPGLIQRIGLNDEVSFANPPDVTGYDDFGRIHLRRIARGLGITYEDMSGDLSNVNFSSARLGRIAMGQNVERWQWHMAIPRLCRPIGTWTMLQWAYDAGNRHNAQALQEARIEWTPPPPVIADPKAETAVSVQRIEAGLSSRRSEIRKSGYDPDAIDAEIDADMKRRANLAAIKAPGATPQVAPGDASETERNLDA